MSKESNHKKVKTEWAYTCDCRTMQANGCYGIEQVRTEITPDKRCTHCGYYAVLSAIKGDKVFGYLGNVERDNKLKKQVDERFVVDEIWAAV